MLIYKGFYKEIVRNIMTHKRVGKAKAKNEDHVVQPNINN